MKKRCVIALGSNLGNSLNIVKSAVQLLIKNENIKLISQSSWYETKPIGPPQPNYINGCIIIETYLKPELLLEILLKIEQQFGRIRKEKWGARTLDLDIILYENLVIKTANLEIPHPHMGDRPFVLIPLAEIAPNLIHPITKLTIFELQKKVNANDVTKIINDNNF